MTSRIRKVISILLILLMAVSLPVFPHVPKVAAAPTWNPPTPVEKYLGHNLLASALQAANGTIWLAWQTDRPAGNGFKIYYKTMTGGIWSSPTAFTTSNKEASPAFAQLQNQTILLIWASNQTAHFNLYYKRFNVGIRGETWSAATRLTTTAQADDSLPSATMTSDGTLWVFWSRATGVDNQIYYKTLQNNAWSSETKLTNDANLNYQPSAIAAKDGTIRLAWASQATGGHYVIKYNTYNGTTWGIPAVIASSTSNDENRPALVQDRNGTIWMFWERTIPVASFFNHDIYSKSSLNYGSTWSADTQMTFDPGGFIYIDEQPMVIQSTTDKSIWAFYSTNVGGTGEFDIYTLRSSPIAPIHDVAMASLTHQAGYIPCKEASPSNCIYAGGLRSIGQSSNITFFMIVSNLGDFNEFVTVNLFATNTTNIIIGSTTGTVLASGQLSLVLTWNTTGIKPARYGLYASVNPVPGESIANQADNSLRLKSQFHILPWGDIEQDGTVDIIDVGVVFYNFGFSCGSPRYTPYADINGVCTIDIISVGVVSKNYGITS